MGRGHVLVLLGRGQVPVTLLGSGHDLRFLAMRFWQLVLISNCLGHKLHTSQQAATNLSNFVGMVRESAFVKDSMRHAAHAPSIAGNKSLVKSL